MEEEEPRRGDFREYRCPDCGAYHVTGTFRKLIDNGRVRSPCIVELLNGRRLLADRQDLPMGSRVRVVCGTASHNGIIAEPLADHLRSEGAVSVKFMPPAPDDKTPNSWMNYWRGPANGIELGWLDPISDEP